MDTKYCRYCQKTLPASEFYQKLGSRDGLEYKCKNCIKAYMANRYANSAQARIAAERIAERDATRERRREERRLRNQERSKAYYTTNRDACRERQRQYQKECREYLAAYASEYQDANALRIRERQKVNYLNRSSESLEKQKAKDRDRYRNMRNAILLKLGAKCFCCGLDDIRFLTIDHIQNDGDIERRPNGRRRNSYSILLSIWRSENFFERYQAACYNCNCARQHSENKTCPHRQ